MIAALSLGCGAEGSEASTGPEDGSSGPTTGGPSSTTGEAQPTSGESSGEIVTTAGTSTTGPIETTGAVECPEHAQLGVWVWNPADITDLSRSAKLLDFAETRTITHLYVESEALLVEDPARLARFLDEAQARCVAVELLFGAASWALAEQHADALALVEASLDFVDALAGARPVALHFDVEPHGLPDWDAMQETYASEYLDLLEQMTARLAGSELPLTVDIAFWYDTVMLLRDGESRPLSELVQDRVDRVVLMNYRDHAEPPDGILDNAATEVAYAARVGRRVRIAVESTCGVEPEKVTFCEEGAIAMSLALELTKSAYAGNPGWDGVAVHDYAAWSVLMD